MSHELAQPAAFGTLLGFAPGDVPVYSSHYASADETALPDRHAYRSYVDGVYMGHKWQCVEFARRWLYMNRGLIFDDVGMAFEIFKLTSVRDVHNNKRLPMRSFENGSRRPPEPGCLLVWDEGGDFERTGHVTVVVEVLPDCVRFAEQNFDHQAWPEGARHARENKAKPGDTGEFWVEPEHQEQRAWLNLANPDEAAFVEFMEGHFLSDKPESEHLCFLMSETARDALELATNQLHTLFMHATDYVLRDDSLLERFCIARVLWPRIHQSWDNRHNQMITGRFDFAMTEHGIKVYEYNCDSAACYLETGKIQGKWAEHFECDIGDDDEREQGYRPGQVHDGPLRLVDVLLRGEVMVFEPLWTLIPSNKAILPVLWSLFPNHPYLLETTVELTDTLRASGYVSKPIVGRCGGNISLFDRDANLIEETAGQFGDREQIYQQLFPLSNVAQLYAQPSTFSVGGAYAASTIRVDRSMVITAESDNVPLRIVEDDRFMEIARRSARDENG